MPFDTEDNMFGVPDYTASQDRIKQKRAQAAKLIDQALTGGGQMAGRIYVPKNPWENFTQGLAGGMFQGSSNTEQQQQARDLKDIQDRLLKSVPEATTTQTATLPDELQGPVGTFTKDNPAYEEDMTKWSLNAARVPGMEKAGAAVLASADRRENRKSREQIAQDAREARSEQNYATQQARKDEAEANRAWREEQNKLYRRPAANITVNGKAPEDVALDRELKQARIEQLKNPRSKMTAAQSKALDDSDVFLQHIDNALGLLDANPDALGAKTMIPDIALQRLDPEGVSTRAAIGGLSAEKVHQLSGAAVSPAEFKRLRPYLPSAGDTTETAKKKLQGLRTEAARIRERHAAVKEQPEQQSAPKAATVVRRVKLKDGRTGVEWSDGRRTTE